MPEIERLSQSTRMTFGVVTLMLKADYTRDAMRRSAKPVISSELCWDMNESDTLIIDGHTVELHFTWYEWSDLHDLIAHNALVLIEIVDLELRWQADRRHWLAQEAKRLRKEHPEKSIEELRRLFPYAFEVE